MINGVKVEMYRTYLMLNEGRENVKILVDKEDLEDFVDLYDSYIENKRATEIAEEDAKEL